MRNKRTILDLQPEQRPDEKCLALGPEALTDAELLAIILRTGSTDETSVELADRILQMSPDGEKSILNLFHAETEDLMKIRGIGKVKALKIKAVIELSRRIAMSSARPQLSFREPQTIAEYYMEQLRHRKKEEVLLLLLDSSCHLIKECVLSVGTVNSAPLSAREVFLMALKYEAVSLILLHNHPSGDPTPSRQDILSTEHIRKAGKIIGLELLDHIIIGDRNYVSFHSSGLLDEEDTDSMD